MTPVALITDFGTTDWYAGALKGSILSVDPSIPIVDITHSIAAGDIQAAAFTLRAAFSSFPPHTVFCSIVDPDVRGERRALVARSDDRFLVGPDNGILSWVLQQNPTSVVHMVHPSMLPQNSRQECTLLRHDLFGYVAGFLASQGDFASIGTPVNNYYTLPVPQSREKGDGFNSTIMAIDRFGNIITAVKNRWITSIHPTIKQVRLRFAGQVHHLLVAKSYCNVPPQELLVYPGSSGYIEIAINKGNAAEQIGCCTGTTISISVE